MKYLILSLVIIISISAYAQNDKIVTLVVSGEGNTESDAKQAALRNAIEQSFGTFISSKTEILSENIIKDEIVSITNGNIQSFEILSSVQIPNGNFNVLLRVFVSLTKLTSFISQKTSMSVSFDGSMYSFNFKLKDFNRENEQKAILHLLKTCESLLENCFMYKLEVKEPKRNSERTNQYDIGFTVTASITNNLNILYEYLLKNLESISMPNSEILNYAQSNFPRFGVLYLIDYSNQIYKLFPRGEFIKSNYPTKNLKYYSYVLRSKYSFLKLVEFDKMITSKIFSFNISYGKNKNIRFDLSRYKSNSGYVCLPYSTIPQNKSYDSKIVIIQPSWYKEISSLSVSGFSHREDRLKQFYNKLFYDNNKFYQSVTGEKMKKSYWPGAGIMYSEGALDRMYSKPDNIERILLSRFRPDFPFLKLDFEMQFTQEQISEIKNFTISSVSYEK